jgi:YidC/Oxa1 family membrane protein insertase
VKILEPLYDLVSWIILTLHRGFANIGMNASWSWCLAIVGLVIMIRMALIPLFVKQIRSMRNMQVLQPQIKKIQERYKGDREKTSQELMKLYKETGTNPLSSCMPVLAQAPIFLALFRVLDGIAKGKTVGVLKPEDIESASHAKFLGASLADKFVGAESLTVQIVTVVMILAMSATQFITQKQLMVKNLPPGSENNPYMKQQKVMMYLFPIMFAVFGINFPVGVLLYWLVSNTWSMGQQLFVIRRMPVEGSIAHKSLMERQARKGKTSRTPKISLGKKAPADVEDDDAWDGGSTPPTAGGGVSTTKRGPAGSNGGPGAKPGPKTGGPTAAGGAGAARPGQQQRQQPQRQPRSKRTGSNKKR